MLHSGKTHQIIQENKRISIEYICNTYLEHQRSRAMIGQIKIRHICDQKILLRDFVSFFGAELFSWQYSHNRRPELYKRVNQKEKICQHN